MVLREEERKPTVENLHYEETKMTMHTKEYQFRESVPSQDFNMGKTDMSAENIREA